MSTFAGTPSDQIADLLAVGDADVTTALISMAARDTGGHDADYLAWHTLDHRPEIHRVRALRAAMRVVSTPACREVRAASEEPYDRVDHVMAYLLAGRDGLGPFAATAGALAAGGRMPLSLPSVTLGIYEPTGRTAASCVNAGADVLPWYPSRGAYLLIEQGAAPAHDLAEVPGVAGVWWFAGGPAAPFPGDATGLQLTWCFLDGDPVETAARMVEVLSSRWSGDGPAPLLAAPFHTIVPYEWDRHLP